MVVLQPCSAGSDTICGTENGEVDDGFHDTSAHQQAMEPPGGMALPTAMPPPGVPAEVHLPSPPPLLRPPVPLPPPVPVEALLVVCWGLVGCREGVVRACARRQVGPASAGQQQLLEIRGLPAEFKTKPPWGVLPDKWDPPPPPPPPPPPGPDKPWPDLLSKVGLTFALFGFPLPRLRSNA